jgi:hypothetical protein
MTVLLVPLAVQMRAASSIEFDPEGCDGLECLIGRSARELSVPFGQCAKTLNIEKIRHA